MGISRREDSQGSSPLFCPGDPSIARSSGVRDWPYKRLERSGHRVGLVPSSLPARRTYFITAEQFQEGQLMKVRFATLTAATLFAAALTMAADGSWTGWISDSQCGVKGANDKAG